MTLDIARVQSALAKFIPLVTGVVALANAFFLGWRSTVVAAGALYFLVGVYLARFIYQRSKNLEAHFGNFSIRPDDDKETREMGDVVMVVLSMVLVVAGGAIPWMAKLTR